MAESPLKQDKEKCQEIIILPKQVETIANSVSFMEYLNNLSSVLKETGYFLLDQAPDIYKIFGDKRDANIVSTYNQNTITKTYTWSPSTTLSSSNIPLDKERYLVYGKCQSGKTGWITSAITSHIVFGKHTTIVLLRNSIGDATQLQTRCDEFITSHQRWMKNKNLNCKNLFNYLYVGSCSTQAKLKTLEESFTNINKPILVIAIANETQINKLLDIISFIENPKFAIAIDEADQIAYGDSGASFRQKLSPILEKAGRTYCVTATSFDILFTDDQIKSSNIIVLDTPKNYKGLRQIELKELVNNEVNPATGKHMWFGNDCNIIPVLKYLSNKTCNAYNDFSPGIVTEQPVITLIKATHLNDLQLELLKKISEHEDLACWDGFVYNGKGLYIFSKNSYLLKKIGNKTGDPVFIEDKNTKKKTLFPNCLFFRKTQVNAGLQYFYNLNEIKTGIISHIVIIAGDLADRCISFVSQNYKWHLTHMYYVPSSGTKTPDIIQSAGRLCGKFNDSFPLFLFSQRLVLEDFVKGILLQEEIIERASAEEKKQEYNNRNKLKVIKVVREMKISASKVPKRTMGVQENTKFEKDQLVYYEKDGGKQMNEYEDIIGKINIGEYKIPMEERLKEEEYKNIDKDNSSKLRIILSESIGANTITMKIYKETYESVLNQVGSNKWINRTKITQDIMKKLNYDRSNIEAHLKNIYQTKYSMENLDTGTGLFMRKVNNIIQLRVK